MSLILCALAGAVARRVAGGVVPVPGGTLAARALGGLVLGAVLWAVAPAVPLLVLAWVPLLFFAGMAAGFPPGGMVPRTPAHVGGISQQHGWALIGPLALWAAAHGMTWWPLVVAAAVVGPIYWAAVLWQPTIPWLGFNRDGLPDPPAWAEVWVGLGLGLALGLAVTGGVR
jgi:hypothetical protein